MERDDPGFAINGQDNTVISRKYRREVGTRGKQIFCSFGESG